MQANTYDAEITKQRGMFITTLRSGPGRLHGVLQGETRGLNVGCEFFFNFQPTWRRSVTGVT